MSTSGKQIIASTLTTYSRTILVTVVAILMLGVTAVLVTYDSRRVSESGRQDQQTINFFHLDHPTYRGLDDLAQSAEYVFIGKITDNGRFREAARKPLDNPHYPDRFKQLPYTDYTLQVTRVIKGAMAEKRATLTQLGGETDTASYVVAHTPRLTRDREYVVFANKNETDNTYAALAGFTAVAELRDGTFRLPDATGTVHQKTWKQRDLDALRQRVNSARE